MIRVIETDPGQTIHIIETRDALPVIETVDSRCGCGARAYYVAPRLLNRSLCCDCAGLWADYVALVPIEAIRERTPGS